MLTRNLLLLTIPLTLAACGTTTTGTRAHDNSAAGHRQEAAAHQAEADQKLAFANSKTYYQSVYLDHKRLAAAHLLAAVELESEYAAACKDDTPEAATR